MEKPAQIINRLIIITIVILGLLGAPQEVSSENGTVVALPAYFAAFTCQSTPISVRVENVTDLTAYHLEIDFTPGDLIVTNVENGGFIPDGEFELTNSYDNDAGTIQFGMAREGSPTQPVDGSGVLINIWVKAVNVSQTVNFTILPYVPGSEPTNGTGSALVGWPDPCQSHIPVRMARFTRSPAHRRIFNFRTARSMKIYRWGRQSEHLLRSIPIRTPFLLIHFLIT